ncbi:MAG: hypothetical protein IJA90_02750 [Peptococcaceae bacterium]|nr:hypothetical protein [Peptococcaceae bacterium]
MNYGRLCALIHRMYAVYIISALKILLPERQGKNNNGFIKILLLNIWTMFAQGRKENREYKQCLLSIDKPCNIVDGKRQMSIIKRFVKYLKYVSYSEEK